MADLVLLRPWWLLALPAGVALLWFWLRRGGGSGAWQQIVEPALQPHVLAMPAVLRDRRWQFAAAVAAMVLAVVALAGPAWERVQVPAFRSDDALVVALDMSRSMDASDVEPTRLERAKLKLLELLERREGGQTALVVFSTHAYTVTPLTTDTRTITAMTHVLATDLMPTQGSVLASGLVKAADLLRQAGLAEGDILLITDSEPGADGMYKAAELRREGFRVSVLAVGTSQGAPIDLPGGGFLTDHRGSMAMPRLNAPALRALADAGGGRFAMLSADGRDLDAVLRPAGGGGVVIEEEPDRQMVAEVWLDRGALLAVLLLPLMALAFRRGWIAVWLVVLLLPMPRAHAFEWSSLWQRSDQRAAAALEAGEAERAAAVADDPLWRGVALYRAGDFAASAEELQALDSVLGHYNRGTALARSGRILEAIAAYDRALELDPEHQDALYNRDLLVQLLEDNPEMADAGDQGTEPQPGDGDSGDSEQQQDGQDGDGDRREAAAGAAGHDDGVPDDEPATADAGAAGDDAVPEPGDMSQEPAEAELAGIEDNGSPDTTALAALEDIDEWASEQAAEQWLRRVTQDPGGLLRRKFELQYRRMRTDQDGNPILPEHESAPW